MKKLIYAIDFLIVSFIGFSLVTYYGVDPSDGVYKSFIAHRWWLVSEAIAVAITIILILLERRFSLQERFLKFVYKRRKSVYSVTLLLVISAAFSVIAEIVLSRFVFGKMTTGRYFNVYRFYFIVAVTFVVAYFVYALVQKCLKPEIAFLTVALASGLVMIFSSPFAHISWDSESHYRMMAGLSNLHGFVTEADNKIINNQLYFFGREDTSAAKSERLIEEYNEIDKCVVGVLGNGNSTVAHLPGGIAMAISRLFKAPISVRYNCARIANLLLYVFVCYFAIRKLKSGKMIMTVIALFPTSIFIAANLGYDTWITAFFMLGMAYFLSEYQQPSKEMTMVDAIIMCASFTLAALPKQIYFPLLLIPFLLKKESFKVNKSAKRLYYAICASAFVILIVAFGFRLVQSATTGGDVRGGDVNALEQMKFILTSPFEYARILIKFLFGYLSLGGTKEYIAFFAYLGYGYGFEIVLAVLIITAVTDKNEYDVITSTVAMKIFMVAEFFVNAVLIATALFVDFTPLHAKTIAGCQGRYIIPLLFPLLSVIGSAKIRNNMNKNAYTAIISLIMAAVSFIGIYGTTVSVMV